ncbi:phosphinothricin acetyltransferase [Pseudoalteromonas rubra]|uniref:Phosphinothricin acetyltransferase n=1 Tax=Pseudoalteromonas rubra TaxID=43658 RepID=A0A4Q7E848_9GAMM|nr:GNAT family N-acetyltransferase [Pseudoalteromonas rubra]RZM78461.1 phosphinothricin acetyltransferase [Pseudoalteromonas rubra]
MIIREFDERDFYSVKEIYQQGIDTGNATFQEQAKDWDEWNNSLLGFCRLVVIEGNQVVGWAGLSPVSGRAVYSGVVEVSVYIASQAQGKGLGHKLLSRLIEESEIHNIWMLQAAIFPENQASIALHKKNGFRQIGVREKLGKMHEIWRDVVLMERRSKTVGV